MTSELDLEAIEERADKATDGPWVHREGYGVYRDLLGARIAKADGYVADAAFIAAARTDVPALVAEVRRLRGQVQAVEAVRAAWVASKKRGGHPYLAMTLSACIGDLDDALALGADGPEAKQ